MNSIYIWGTPNGVDEDIYKTVTKLLIDIFKSRDMEPLAVFFPTDRMNWGLGEEIIVHISGPIVLGGKELDRLTKSVGRVVQSGFRPKHIKCVVLKEKSSVGSGHWSSS